MENDVFVLIFGATDGAYALAHAFFHDYGIRPTVVDEDAPFYIRESAALTYERVTGLADGRMLLLTAERFYEKHSGKSLFLIAAREEYAAVAEADRARLETMFFIPRLHRGNVALKNAKGLLFAYRSAERESCVAYGRVAAYDGEGLPTVVLAEDAPKTDAFDLPTRGVALLAEGEDGRFAPVGEPICSHLFFLTAADVSLPELLINDYVLCEALPKEETVRGAFSLYPYQRLKSRVL
ncbi:MAG: hypothetical protein J6W28_07735, partial [Clostridia bacterium]|nr:hypothetical protein [Clostridia bacterium]